MALGRGEMVWGFIVVSKTFVPCVRHTMVVSAFVLVISTALFLFYVRTTVKRIQHYPTHRK